MNKLVTGMIAGGFIGAAGVAGLAMMDYRTRKRVMKSGESLMGKAEDAIDDIRHMY